jgi:hypothetical protein
MLPFAEVVAGLQGRVGVRISTRTGPNPFIYGPVVPPEGFYGRVIQRENIKHWIGDKPIPGVSIIGTRRSGKSSLMRYIREHINEFCNHEQLVIVMFDLQDSRFQTQEGINEGLRRSIEKTTGNSPWQRDENVDAWAVYEGLERLHEDGHRLLVLIDEFDRIGMRLDEFENWGSDWRAKASEGFLTMVIASLRPIDEIYPSSPLSSPFGNIFHTIALGALEPAEWQKLVHDGFAVTGDVLSEDDIQLIDELAGGHPFYTQLAAALLWQHGSHSHTRTRFAQQSVPSFTALWQTLTEQERQALCHAAGVSGLTEPAIGLRERLQDYGLLRANGGLFSSIFADFCKEQQSDE